MEWEKTKRGPQNNLRQTTEQPAPTRGLPSRSSYKNCDWADKVKIRPISGTNQATPSTNQNNNFSDSLGARPDSREKIKMPTTIQISPRPSTGKKPFKFNVNFDMSRTKIILSEDVETNSQPLNCVGEVTFKVIIEERASVHGSPATLREDNQYLAQE